MIPSGYREHCRVDFEKNREQLVTVSTWSVVLLIATVLLGIPFGSLRETFAHPACFAIVLFYIPYIFLHELTHGLFIRIYSGKRPTYGLSLQYAYAGSEHWFTRGQHRIIALAPVVLFTILYTVAIHMLPVCFFWPIWLLEAFNISGAAGDLFCVWFFLYKPKDILIQDSGTDMTVIVPETNTRIETL